MLRSRLFLEWCAILLFSAGLAWWAAASGAMARLDLPLLDLASTARAAPASDDIVIAAIDERSLAQEGAWPWDRRRLAALVDRLAGAGARVIVLDILLTEPTSPEADAALAGAMARAGNVALPHGFIPAVDRAEGFVAEPPLAALAAAARVTGHVVAEPDSDGAVRHVPLLVDAGARRHAHLQLEVHRWLEGNEAAALSHGGPLVARALPYRPAGSFRTVPAASVLAGEVPAGFLRGRIVIVGATAAGLGDILPVPAAAGSVMPGAEIQANVLQALAGDEFVRPLSPALLQWLSVLPVLLLFLAFWRLRPLACLLLALALVVAAGLGSLLLAGLGGLWIAPGAAILALVVAYPLWGWRRLAAVSNFLTSESLRLVSSVGEAPVASVGGFDNVARQVSRLHWLVDEMTGRRDFLTRVIEAAPDAICVFAGEGQLQLMNQRARALFGEDTPGLSFRDLVHSSGGGLSADGRELTFADGTCFTVAESGPGAGGIRVVVLSDITEARRAEEDRRQMLEFLSHDMRSPQVAILGLSEERPGSPAPAERLARIRGHASRTLKLADDFVQLSRLAEVPLEREDVDLAMLAEEAMDSAWFAAREKGIELVRDLPDEPAWVHADGQVLLRAIDNLISNAIRYGPSGSRVTIGVAAQDGRVRLSIADQGPGLPPARWEDPFRRFGAREKAAGGGGAGLGLAFVREAVERHGGAIACDTGGEGGTTFVIEVAALDAG